ncbi:MAG TPA: hypothetical protein VL860_09575, partial [Planctomycetota bacterium]|nr:hypothetical protein [Planctomycetota bacterium]
MADVLFDLQRRLHSVRQKERLVTGVAGVSRLFLWLLLLLAFFFVLDIWIVRSLDTVESYLVRALLTLVVLGLIAWRGWIALFRPLRTHLDDDLMALRVENAHPELRHRLISTLQLGRAAADDQLVGSTELVAALEAETVSFTRAIPFPSVVLFKPAWDWLWKALVCLLLAAGLCMAFPKHASAFFMRLMFLDRDYPTRVVLDKIDCLNVAGEVVLDEESFKTASAANAKTAFNPPVAAGDATQVRVFPAVDAELPLDEEGRFSDGVLVYQYTDGPNVGVDHELTLSVPKDLAKSGAELIRSGKGPHSGAPEWETFRKGLFWKATIDAVTDPFRATAELDDGRIAWKRFQVLPRPVVRTIKLTVTPPDYTPLSPEAHDKTGDVAAIQGSIVKVELQATQKLLHAQLQFSDG